MPVGKPAPARIRYDFILWIGGLFVALLPFVYVSMLYIVKREPMQ
jgi:hypothetical protein